MLTLRVLLVEDSEDDALLLVHQLEVGGYFPVWERVETAEQMQAALSQKSWDLVLSDYNLPRFNGLHALNLLKKNHLDIPFILISGVIGEEVAVAAMKAGAHDYLLKDNLARLIPAVERELKEARDRHSLRQAEEARRELETQLAQAKDFAEAANQRKSQVLAFVAHEIKNPLMAVTMHAELLEKRLKEDAPPDADRYLRGVRNILMGTQHLSSLISDILDIAAIEAGRIELSLELIDVQTLVNEIQVLLGEIARRKSISLTFDVVGDVQHVKADPKRLKQVLINLLSNAIKYTENGGHVSLSLSRSGDQGWFVWRVQDNGIGISEEELEKLFTEFYRVKNMYAPQREGLGLGLALAKKLVELHHGRIHVHSKLGEGSTFTVELPALNVAFYDVEPAREHAI